MVPKKPPNTTSSTLRLPVRASANDVETTPTVCWIWRSSARGLPRKSTGGSSRHRGIISRVSSLTRVDFPEPLGPSTTTRSPSSMTKSSTSKMMRPSLRTCALCSLSNS